MQTSSQILNSLFSMLVSTSMPRAAGVDYRVAKELMRNCIAPTESWARTSSTALPSRLGADAIPQHPETGVEHHSPTPLFGAILQVSAPSERHGSVSLLIAVSKSKLGPTRSDRTI